MSLYVTEPLDIFRALADATRLRIVALVRRMELSVGELAQVLGQSQPRVSRHVKILVDARLLERRKEGSWVFVAMGDDAVARPLSAALDAWGRGRRGPKVENDSLLKNKMLNNDKGSSNSNKF